MRSLFRSFERAGLDYLLISGQASVLYGAATVTEDIDLWVESTPGNARRLLEALARRRATVYKLTPPLLPRFLRGGHGFHFLVPCGDGPVYLDVLFRPPRVGTFRGALRRARRLPTDWGPLPVVGIRDLVELKKTRRLPDYEAISNLVQVALRETPHPGLPLQRWAASNTFRGEDLEELLRRFPRTAELERPAIRALARGRSGSRAREVLALEIAALQSRDTDYWARRREELRALRDSGRLLEVGLPVRALL